MNTLKCEPEIIDHLSDCVYEPDVELRCKIHGRLLRLGENPLYGFNKAALYMDLKSEWQKHLDTVAHDTAPHELHALPVHLL